MLIGFNKNVSLKNDDWFLKTTLKPTKCFFKKCQKCFLQKCQCTPHMRHLKMTLWNHFLESSSPLILQWKWRGRFILYTIAPCIQILCLQMLHSLRLTTSPPKRGNHPKNNFIFQAFVQGRAVSFREGISKKCCYWNKTPRQYEMIPDTQWNKHLVSANNFSHWIIFHLQWYLEL